MSSKFVGYGVKLFKTLKSPVTQLKRLKPKRFRNLVSIWLKLPFVKTKTKVYSKSYMAQLKQIKNKLQKRAAELKKADLQKKKSSSILAARRK